MGMEKEGRLSPSLSSFPSHPSRHVGETEKETTGDETGVNFFKHVKTSAFSNLFPEFEKDLQLFNCL